MLKFEEVSDIGEKLTTKQRKFADEYIKSGNATQAYKLAYSTKNMSPTSINSEATKTLRKPIVKVALLVSAWIEIESPTPATPSTNKSHSL